MGRSADELEVRFYGYASCQRMYRLLRIVVPEDWLEGERHANEGVGVGCDGCVCDGVRRAGGGERGERGKWAADGQVAGDGGFLWDVDVCADAVDAGGREADWELSRRQGALCGEERRRQHG